MQTMQEHSREIPMMLNYGLGEGIDCHCFYIIIPYLDTCLTSLERMNWQKQERLQRKHSLLSITGTVERGRTEYGRMGVID